jgi:replication factor A1
LNVSDLQDGSKKVTVKATVVEKGEVREVKSRYKDETYRICDAMVADETGAVKLTLWNAQVDLVGKGDIVEVENGYVTSFKGELQLNVGKFGKLKIC